jgi:hypothetical protein
MVVMKLKNKFMKYLRKIILFSFIIFSSSLVFSVTTETIRVDFSEKVSSSNYFDYYSNVKTYHSNNINNYNSENLVLYYPFNYNNISNKDDYSANDIQFTEEGGVIWNSLGCIDNSGCYVFDGVDDYLDIDSVNLGNTDSFSYSFFIKVNSFSNGIATSGDGTYFLDRQVVSNSLFSLKAIAGKFALQKRYSDSTGLGVVLGEDISLGVWTHIVMVRDYNNFIRLYVNGELSGSVIDTSITLDHQLIRFGSHQGVLGLFDGLMDEFRVYDKALNLEEIERIYSKSEDKFTGTINVSNTHASEPVYDVEIFVNSSNFTSTPYFNSGNSGYIMNATADGFVLFVPELDVGDNTLFNYDIYPVNKFPILFNTSTPDSRVMSGTQFTMTDRLSNVFENYLGQDGCLYNVSISHDSLILTGDSSDRVKFDSGSISGSGAGDVVFAGDEYSFYWDVNSGGCFNVSDNYLINYEILLPSGTSFTGEHDISNSTLSFSLQDVFSGVNVDKIYGISNANISLEKEIINFSDSDFSDSNVTWNVNSSFFTSSQLSYELNKATIWVSQKNISGIYADPNTIENDSVSSSSLVQDFTPGSIVDLTTPWVSTNWNFNFSGFDNPVVWFDVDFTLLDDGTQLVKSKESDSTSSSYLRGISLINGYWLDINKSVTSIGNNSYNIEIKVSNKGTLSTPASSVVTIYDLIPSNFALDGTIVKSNPSFYDVAENTNPISGELSGDLLQWGILPTNSKNVSLDKGVGFGENNSILISYNITGSGDYNSLDVFITGLDPQKIEGAGGSSTIILIENFLDEASNFWFGLVSVILFGLILLI